jgi:hypothetical protein
MNFDRPQSTHQRHSELLDVQTWTINAKMVDFYCQFILILDFSISFLFSPLQLTSGGVESHGNGHVRVRYIPLAFSRV